MDLLLQVFFYLKISLFTFILFLLVFFFFSNFIEKVMSSQSPYISKSQAKAAPPGLGPRLVLPGHLIPFLASSVLTSASAGS